MGSIPVLTCTLYLAAAAPISTQPPTPAKPSATVSALATHCQLPLYGTQFGGTRSSAIVQASRMVVWFALVPAAAQAAAASAPTPSRQWRVRFPMHVGPVLGQCF